MPIEPPVPFVRTGADPAVLPDKKITVDDVVDGEVDPTLLITAQMAVDQHNGMVDLREHQALIRAWLEAENRWEANR